MTLQDAFNSARGPALDGRSEDDILEMLQTAEIAETGLHPDGSNYVFIVRFETDLAGDAPPLGVVQPPSGAGMFSFLSSRNNNCSISSLFGFSNICSTPRKSHRRLLFTLT